MNPDSYSTNQDTLMPPIGNQNTNDQMAPRAVRTFEDDIAGAVRDGKGSVLTIALAEQARKEGAVVDAVKKKSNVMFIIAGIFLFVISLGVVGYIVFEKYGAQVFPDIVRGTASFAHPSIRSDKTTPIPIDTLLPKNGITQSMLYKLGGSSLSTGAVALAIPTVTDSAGAAAMAETDVILKRLAPNAPSILSRSLATSTVLGIYSGDVAEPFIVLKTSSYEGAFSGMLGWEDFMSDDLYTFMGITPPSQSDVPQTTTADQADALPVVIGTSTEATTTPKKIEVVSTGPSRDITKFIDRTIKNKDMRVIEDNTGKIHFLYGFANPSTIIITTSPETFFEVSSRLR